MLEANTGGRLYWVGHGVLEDMKRVNLALPVWEKAPKRCNRQLAENHNWYEHTLRLRAERYATYKAVGHTGGTYQ